MNAPLEALAQLQTQIQQQATGPPIRIVSSAEFVAGFVPPDYLIDGILQKQFIYSITAPTGAGKTAILLATAAYVPRATPLGEREVTAGRVLYLAGENPDDIRMRWIAMSDLMLFDAGDIDVHFIAGAFDIAKLYARVSEEVKKLGPVALVIVDTSAAYFGGDNENDNVQMGAHARTLRALTTLPGKPCVLVACHPTKNAAPDNLLPRGGGAFLAEMDGNLVCSKQGLVVDVHWQGKFRGPEFEPIGFELIPVTSQRLMDSRGRYVPTVMAKPMQEARRNDLEAAARSDEDAVLAYMAAHPDASMADIATGLKWLTSALKPHKAKVHRATEKLRRDKLAAKERDRWTLTKRGEAAANRGQNK